MRTFKLVTMQPFQGDKGAFVTYNPETFYVMADKFEVLDGGSNIIFSNSLMEVTDFFKRPWTCTEVK